MASLYGYCCMRFHHCSPFLTAVGMQLLRGLNASDASCGGLCQNWRLRPREKTCKLAKDAPIWETCVLAAEVIALVHFVLAGMHLHPSQCKCLSRLRRAPIDSQHASDATKSEQVYNVTHCEVNARDVSCVLMKAVREPYWPHLLHGAHKPKTMKVDWGKVRLSLPECVFTCSRLACLPPSICLLSRSSAVASCMLSDPTNAHTRCNNGSGSTKTRTGCGGTRMWTGRGSGGSTTMKMRYR